MTYKIGDKVWIPIRYKGYLYTWTPGVIVSRRGSQVLATSVYSSIESLYEDFEVKLRNPGKQGRDKPEIEMTFNSIHKLYNER